MESTSSLLVRRFWPWLLPVYHGKDLRCWEVGLCPRSIHDIESDVRHQVTLEPPGRMKRSTMRQMVARFPQLSPGRTDVGEYKHTASGNLGRGSCSSDTIGSIVAQTTGEYEVCSANPTHSSPARCLGDGRTSWHHQPD